MLLLATIPVTLWAGRRVMSDLSRTLRAKKALEEAVLHLARTDEAARTALAAAATDAARAQEANALVTGAASRLAREYAEPVRRALALGEYQRQTGYIESIVRHVNAKLAHQG
jgi:hypothetical protein